ncbi:MAG: DNA adenine methylase [Chloroflexi bacterium]|nr:DNA adenine methylase [Chloroflexota bacterium]
MALDPQQPNPTQDQSSPARRAKPFLKWVGGKSQLLAQFDTLFPTTISRYVEPFVGGGAVFFHLWNTGRITDQAFLFDHNAELVNAYRVVRDQVEALMAILAEHQQQHSKEYYYRVRGLDREDVTLSDVERAARTIYLNRTCYNGLYRVNSKGQFNVPMGSYKNPHVLRAGVLQAASCALQNAQVEVRDFRAVVELAQPGDFFYFDPPYVPLSKTASFTSYTADDFSADDQHDLAGVFAQLSDLGCRCMLSNSHTPLVVELYRDFRIETVQAKRAVNSDTNGRGVVDEVVVLNY